MRTDKGGPPLRARASLPGTNADVTRLRAVMAELGHHRADIADGNSAVGRLQVPRVRTGLSHVGGLSFRARCRTATAEASAPRPANRAIRPGRASLSGRAPPVAGSAGAGGAVASTPAGGLMVGIDSRPGAVGLAVEVAVGMELSVGVAVSVAVGVSVGVDVGAGFGPSPRTSRGMGCVRPSNVPMPRTPVAFPPQHRTPPSSLSAHVWNPPAATPVAPDRISRHRPASGS